MKNPNSGDAWVIGPDGSKYWGKYGAAGLVVYDPNRGVLLQHRAVWSHHGGTWGIPGGARQSGETAEVAAKREVTEETGLDTAKLQVLFEDIYDLEFWSYTTVFTVTEQSLEAVVSDPESLELRWVQPENFKDYELHPSFAASWDRIWSNFQKNWLIAGKEPGSI